MSGQLLQFEPWLQEPVEAGCLAPATAWQLDWEMSVLLDQPWSPGMQEVFLRVHLFHEECQGSMQ